jgi:hypothetical protein
MAAAQYTRWPTPDQSGGLIKWACEGTGMADRPNATTAAFRAAWVRPLSPEKADEKCSL